MEDLRIVLLGKTGSGKSSTGNTILGRDVRFEVGYLSESTTKRCEIHTVEGINISVIDTPGLFHTSMTKEDVKAEIEKSLRMSAPGPHVFLMVIKLGRFTKEEKKTVKWIQENFGEAAKKFTMILFTGVDKLGKTIEEFLQENPKMKELLDDCETEYQAFTNLEKNNQTQVTELQEKIKTIVKKNEGQYYTEEMYQETQRKITEEEEKRKRQETVSQNRQEIEDNKQPTLTPYLGTEDISMMTILGGGVGLAIGLIMSYCVYSCARQRQLL